MAQNEEKGIFPVMHLFEDLLRLKSQDKCILSHSLLQIVLVVPQGALLRTRIRLPESAECKSGKSFHSLLSSMMMQNLQDPSLKSICLYKQEVSSLAPGMPKQTGDHSIVMFWSPSASCPGSCHTSLLQVLESGRRQVFLHVLRCPLLLVASLFLVVWPGAPFVASWSTQIADFGDPGHRAPEHLDRPGRTRCWCETSSANSSVFRVQDDVTIFT